jgi:hypothetical protein
MSDALEHLEDRFYSNNFRLPTVKKDGAYFTAYAQKIAESMWPGDSFSYMGCGWNSK